MHQWTPWYVLLRLRVGRVVAQSASSAITSVEWHGPKPSTSEVHYFPGGEIQARNGPLPHRRVGRGLLGGGSDLDLQVGGAPPSSCHAGLHRDSRRLRDDATRESRIREGVGGRRRPSRQVPSHSHDRVGSMTPRALRVPLSRCSGRLTRGCTGPTPVWGRVGRHMLCLPALLVR